LRKIIYILFILILSGSCSVSRKLERKTNRSSKAEDNENVYHSIINQNITARSFYVERAEFKIKSDDVEKSGVGTIKFLLPDRFLISIKSKTGIEAARIYISGDSIKINDRIDKKVFYGSASYLNTKYGVTTSILPIILGDYLNDMSVDSSKLNCSEGKLKIEGIKKNVRIRYLIDCEKGKSILTIPDKDNSENGIQIRYSDFFNVNNINTPGKIEISDSQRNTTIEIKIERILIPWEGTIEFIPGKLYEKIILL
jgi:hypothetical protein